MKPGLFSFVGDEFENLFQYSDLFLPGIEKIAGIYYSGRSRKIAVLSRKRDEEIETEFDELLDKRENLVMIQKYRSESHPFTWVRKDDLPFELPDRKHAIAPSLFTELEHVILVLRFKNKLDLLNDFLLVYFNQNLGNFGLNRSEKVLSVENKTIIGHLLYHQFRSILEMNRTDRDLLRTLNNVVRSVITENNSLKDQLNQLRASYGENILNTALQHLKDISESYNREYILAEESLEKIRNFKGNLKHLPAILKNAIIFTENLMMPDELQPVTLPPYSLDFESYQVVGREEQAPRKIDSRQARVVQLLDKLERAALMLKSRNIPLIGSRVGQAMDPPVTAPAITDALGKNRDVIRQVLEKYPNKWEAIRKDFKPLTNQLRKSMADETEADSA